MFEVGDIVVTYMGFWKVHSLPSSISSIRNHWHILERQGSFGVFDGNLFVKANKKETHKFKLSESRNDV